MTNEYGVDLDRVRKFLAQKNEHRRSLLKTRWEEANRNVTSIVEHIRRVYKSSRIYQWGSLLDFSSFSEISDIDIALEGLKGAEEYFAILGDAMKMTDFPLDIVEMEKLDPETAEGIRKRGKLVYERGTE